MDRVRSRARRGGATGIFTITLLRAGAIRVGGSRPVTEHWAYDGRAQALDELGLILERVTPGTELVLRDPEGVELMRVARLA